jgi:hypothetical protein
MLRWKLQDPRDTNTATNTYTFTQNPTQMTSPFQGRNLVAQGTVLPGGRVLMWEGNKSAGQWQFRGSIRNKAHYENLRKWVFERGNRIYLTDHFGRQMVVVLQDFQPEPRRSVGVYWRHDYTIVAQVISVGPPTVDEQGNKL